MKIQFNYTVYSEQRGTVAMFKHYADAAAFVSSHAIPLEILPYTSEVIWEDNIGSVRMNLQGDSAGYPEETIGVW